MLTQFAQQAYESPREATGRIVCANCHLAQKKTEVEVPQAVLPDTVFEAVVSIPYDLSSKQVTAGGTRGPLNVGAVVILPEGFQLAPKDRLSDEIKSKTKGVFISPYSKSKPNILVVGPIDGAKNQEIVFPILSPDPAENKKVNFLNYPIYLGVIVVEVKYTLVEKKVTIILLLQQRLVRLLQLKMLIRVKKQLLLQNLTVVQQH